MIPANTQAETGSPSYVPNIPPAAEGAVGIVGTFVTIVGVIMYLRRKLSRDGTEIIKDRAEGHLLSQYIKDRENLMKEHDTEIKAERAEREAAKASERMAWDKANAMAVENARLKSDNEYQQREIARLTAAMNHLQIEFDKIKVRLQALSTGATGHSGFNDPF